MRPPSIILFGGTKEQHSNIKNFTPAPFTILTYPLRHLPTDSDLRCQKILFAVIQNTVTENGLEQLKRLKKRYPAIPVVMLESQPSHQDIVQAFRLGASDFLEFPLSKMEWQTYVIQKAVVFQERWLKKEGFWALVQKRVIHYWQRFRLFWRNPQNRKKVKYLQWKSQPHAVTLIEPKHASTPFIACRFLGPFEIIFLGKKLKKVPGKKVKSLLTYLLYHHQKPIHREILMNTFWPYSSPSSARNSLNSGIYAIRKLFHSVEKKIEVLLYQNECYSINPQLSIISDFEKFSNYWRMGRELDIDKGLEHAVSNYHKAIEQYRNDFLEDLLSENWCEPIRDNLRESYLLVLNRLSLFYFRENVYSVAMNMCKKMLSIDPYLEEIHQRLIICYHQTGSRKKAISQFQKCKTILNQELKINPSEQTTEIIRGIINSSAN